MGQEIEIKLGVRAEDLSRIDTLTVLERAEKRDDLKLANVYFDTPEQVLAAHKVALRVRSAGDKHLQTLKTAGTSAAGFSVRKEWEWERPEATLDLSLVTEHLPESLSELKLEQLHPLLATDFNRRLWWVSGEDNGEAWAVEISLDQGEIRTVGGNAPICELELELKAGNPLRLFALAQEIARQIPLHAIDISKAERGYQLLNGEHPLPSISLSSSVDESDSELLQILQQGTKAWPELLEAGRQGNEDAQVECLKTLDLMLAAMNGVPELGSECPVLISQYQRVRADVAAACDWRLLPQMPENWKQAQRDLAVKRLQRLCNKTLPGQLALATGELLWQLQDEE